MKKARKIYDDSFKLQVVKIITEQNLSITQVLAKQRLSAGLINTKPNPWWQPQVVD